MNSTQWRHAQGPSPRQSCNAGTRLQGRVSRHQPSRIQAGKIALTTPLNTEELGKLPSRKLAQLLLQALAERDTAELDVYDWKEKVQHLRTQHRRYDLDPPLHGEHVDMAVWGPRLEAVRKKWAPRTEREGWERKAWEDPWRANPSRFLTYGRVTKRFDFGNYDGKDMSCVISSPLLLYRVCCMFDGIHVDVHGKEGRNYVWNAEVEHIATGEIMGFGEWKRGSLVLATTWDGPQEFTDDILELLNLLCDPKFPHPCGVVAGSVAW